MKKGVQKLKYFARARYVKDGPWMLIRPHQHSLLRQSLIAESAKLEPRLIWGLKKEGGFKEDEFGYWYKNYPNPDFMIRKILHDPVWFKKKLKERKEVFQRTIVYLNDLEKNIKKRKGIDFYWGMLKKGKGVFIEMKMYLDFISIPNDYLLLKFYHFVNSFLDQKKSFDFILSYFRVPLKERKRLKLFASFLHPILYGSFFHSLGREKYTPLISGYQGTFIRDFTISPSNIFSTKKLKFFKKYQKGFLQKRFLKIIKKQSRDKLDKFAIFNKFIPLLEILHEESANLHNALLINFNYVLNKIATDLIRRKLIRTKTDLLKWSIDRVILKSKI